MKKVLPKHLSQLGLALLSPLALMLALILLMPQPVYAAGPVTTCTESALRIALTGGGLVTFTCGPATITLTAPITVTRSTTIDGGGLITFLGDGNSRIFDVTDNSVPNFELKLIGLTVSGGRADSGGAVVVDNGNTVTVVNSTLSNNVVQARGGAIYAASAATVNITNSTVISNLAGGSGSAEGGAIYTMFATVNIVNSAIISNTVSDNRDGGGMYNFESDLILVNSTLSHNNTGNRGGALVVNQSTALITNTTISGNSATRGGGLVIFNGGTVNTKNTIIAGNTAPSGGPDCDFDSVTSQGYNLIGDTSGCTITGDLTGNITNQNPLLGSLADNGGATPTHALLSGSPAINAGDNAACAASPVNSVDQRGVARPQGTTCDIGAFEATANLTVAKSAVNESGDPLRPGERITYTITITNSGSLTSTGTTVSDTFPINTSFVPGSIKITPAVGGAAGTQPILADGITVAADSAVTVTYAVTISKPLTNGTVIKNTASVTSTESSAPTTSEPVTGTVVSSHTLEVRKTVAPAFVSPGGLLTYTIAYTVTGDAPANVTISDTTPAHTTFFAAAPPAGSQPSIGGTGPVIWVQGGLLPAGSGITQQTGLVTVTVRANTPLTDGIRITNTVTITSAEVSMPQTDTTTSIVFAPNLTTNTVGNGSVIREPDQSTYTYGQVVSLTAQTNPGWNFTSWSGDLTGSTSPVTVTMTGDKVVTATFTAIPYTLTTNTIGNGAVISDPVQSTYTYGDVVTLTANADLGWSFDSWSGDLSGSTITETLVITGNRAVIATFTENSSTAGPIFLPIIMSNFVLPATPPPDLVVQNIIATGSTVQVVIKNQGNGPVPVNTANEFWVDLYVNPVPPPTGVNQTCQSGGISCSQFAVWGITQTLLSQLGPQGVITLTVGDANQYFGDFSMSLAPDTPVYAQVDSDNALTTYGAVQESNENNNIFSVLSVAGIPEATTVEMPLSGERPLPSTHLPPRSSK